MKTLVKLAGLSALALLVYKYIKKKSVVENEAEFVAFESKTENLPELNKDTKLSDALVQSFRVQAKVMMDSYPENHQIDIVHSLSFIDFNQLHAYTEFLRSEKIIFEEDIEHLSLRLRNTITTDAQTAFNEIVKIAESALEYHGIYQGWVFENIQ